jgi:hypothetical protein
MNTDVVVDVSDRDTDALNVLFNTAEGRDHLRRRGVDEDTIAALDSFGLSSICNVLGAIKVAKLLGMGADDVIVTVATDGAAMYRTEVDKVLARDFPQRFGEAEAAETFGRSLEGQETSDMLGLTDDDRERIFNRYTVSMGMPIEDFVARRDQAFWRGLREQVPAWDEAIRAFNASTGIEAT